MENGRPARAGRYVSLSEIGKWRPYANLRDRRQRGAIRPEERALDTPLVDCHAHIYTRETPLAPGAWHAPAAEARLEDYLSVLDTHGVARAVLAGASIFGDYNDYALAATRRHERLRTTVIVRPDIDYYTLRAMDADGAVGIRLQLMHRDLPDLTGFDYRKLLRRVADLGWHVHVHDHGPRLAQSLPVLVASGVRLVIDHFGRPDPEKGVNCDGFGAVLKAIETGRTWVKLSAAFRLASPALAEAAAKVLIANAGGERLVWGSDWPFAGFEGRIRYQDTIAAFGSLIPDPVLRRQIGADTPLALYFR